MADKTLVQLALDLHADQNLMDDFIKNIDDEKKLTEWLKSKNITASASDVDQIINKKEDMKKHRESNY